MIYTMICKACCTPQDVSAPMVDGPPKECPLCGELALEKVYTAVPAHLYGPGTYSHDYKRRVWKKGC